MFGLSEIADHCKKHNCANCADNNECEEYQKYLYRQAEIRKNK